jgi:tubulin polyglutamylase TTLL6/13
MDIKYDRDETLDWDIVWSDVGVLPDRISKLSPYQRINALPNIALLARKNNLAKHLMRMAKAYKDEYNFFPKTWCLPSDSNDLKN